MDNIVTNVYAKFDDDRLWNEKALVDRKSDNNKHPNNVVVTGEPFPGPKTIN